MRYRPTLRMSRFTFRAAATALMAVLLVAYGRIAGAQDVTTPGSTEGGRIVARQAVEAPLHDALLREMARLAQDPAPAQTPPNEQDRQWVARHPVITGTLIGAGVGAVLSRTRTVGGYNHDPRVALAGAGIGAWSGLVASAVHKARVKEKIGVGAKIGIVAGAIGLVVVPLLACYGAGGCGGTS